MNVMKSLRQCSKHFLQFSLTFGSNSSKRVFKNSALRAVSSNVANTGQPLINEKSSKEPDSSFSAKIPEPIDFATQKRRTYVICVLQMDFIFFAEMFTDDYRLGPGGYDEALWTMGESFAKPNYWQSLLQNSKDESHIEMKEMLKKDDVPESLLFSAMAKLCQYLYLPQNLCLRFNPEYKYTPDDVLDVLKNVDLNDVEYEALATLFSFEPFNRHRLLFPFIEN